MVVLEALEILQTNTSMTKVILIVNFLMIVEVPCKAVEQKHNKT